VRPQVRVILHTSSADGAKQARARELGLTVLVKGDFDATIVAVTESDSKLVFYAGNALSESSASHKPRSRASSARPASLSRQ